MGLGAVHSVQYLQHIEEGSELPDIHPRAPKKEDATQAVTAVLFRSVSVARAMKVMCCAWRTRASFNVAV